MKRYKRLLTIHFLVGLILINQTVWAQSVPNDSIDWQNLDLTGSYYKKKTREGVPLWPIFLGGAAGAGVAGYFIYKGSIPTIVAKDDQSSVSCQKSTSIDVLANDSGDGIEIVEVFGQPEHIQITIAPNSNLNIENVGNTSFSFKYKIRDKHDAEAEATVNVRIEAMDLKAVDDHYSVVGGELLEGNVMENDIGTSIIVIDYTEFTSGTVNVNENGDFTLNASDTICDVNQFTYTIKDVCENQATATVFVESEDTEVPTITCPAGLTLECTDDTGPDNTGQPIVDDNCDADPTVSYVDDLVDGSCPSNKSLLRTWTVVDASENSSSCVQTILIRDNTPPEIICPANLSLICGESLDPDATGRATATDNCTASEDIVIDYSDNLSGLTDCGGSTGTILRTWTARDLCGNETQCVQTISLTDDVPPIIFCPPNLTIGCDQGIDPSTTSRPTASDNCTEAMAINFTYVDDIAGSIDCSASGVVTRTWTATDLCGNYNTCIQTINVETIAGPEITCPTGATVSCDESTDPSLTGRPNAITHCAIPGEIVYDYHDNAGGLNGCGNTGVIVRTWTATDPCSISSTCIQNINVVDNTPPVISCPADITVSCDASTDPVATGNATATDNCSPATDVTIDYVDDLSGLNGCGNTGVILRTWTASDACGNMTSCVQTITVEDTTPPVISCPSDVTINCEESIDPASLGSASAVDNCSSNGDIIIAYSDNTSGLSGCGGTGVLLRTWSATDPCGNVSSCVQSITIVDNTAPQLECPVDITINCQDDISPSVTGEPTVTDNCTSEADMTVSYSDDASGRTGCNGTGTIVRTWTATDACGNASVCTQNILIEDNEAPDISCPADVVISCEESINPSNTGTATATDNCTANGLVSITYTDDVSGLTGCGSTGTLVRTWTATDLCGNQSQCIQNIIIQDLTPPEIVCPANISITCDESTDPSNTGMAVATDNCTPTNQLVITYSDVVSGNIDCTGDGQIDRTWTVSDICGNVRTCLQTILVRSTTPPSISCPVNITIDCDDDVSPDNTGRPVAATACSLPGELSYTYSDNVSGLTGCNGTGTMFRTWTVTDPCGLSNSCVQQITIVDLTPPEVICPIDLTISCDQTIDPANTGFPAVTDNCTAQTDLVIGYSDVISGPLNCTGVTTITRTWTAQDLCGNISSCIQNVRVEPVAGPTIVCPPDLTLNCTASTDPVNTGRATASTDCTLAGEITINYTDDQSGMNVCGNTGVILRTWSATDPCGITSICTQRITLEDHTPPSIVCPMPVTIGCDESTDPSNTGSATADDDCSEAGDVSITYSDDLTGLTGCSATGVLQRTWTATDACGNASSCTQSITIQDITPPAISCPANITVECDDPTDPSSTGQATATDNCSSVSISHSDVANLAGCGGTGSITRTWTAEDACGNTASCIQTITVIDTQAPTISCPANVSVQCGTSTEPSVTGEATATDNCSSVIVSHTDVIDASGCGGTGTITRTWTATDDCGNASACVQTITIVDTQPPAITCPPNVTVSCNESTLPSNTGQATASEVCSTASIKYDDVSDLSGCGGTGTITRTWYAADDCGNESTCVQVITVADTDPPTLVCPANITIGCNSSTDPDDTGRASASDICSTVTITYSDAPNAGVGCGGKTSINRTWRAEDACNNVSTCVQVITINDTEAPVITCPSDITINCDESSDPANTGYASATDACSGVVVNYTDNEVGGGCVGSSTITRTWTATDDCGNTSSCIQTITIIDTEAPVITCPGDVTISCTDSSNPNSTGLATATDACSNATISISDVVTPGGCAGESTITRTFTARDDCGNTSSCVQTITIVDAEAPAITCPADITIECDADSSPAGTGTATATDNCSGVTISHSDVVSPGSCASASTIARTWTAIDGCGNSSSCVQTITIEDSVDPVITCPASVTIACGTDSSPATTGTATATDNCSGVSVTHSDVTTPGSCAAESVISRTWTATDDCGNSSSCVQTITIEDNVNPVIDYCPPDVTIDCTDDSSPAGTGTATATDNCSGVTVTHNDVTTPGSCAAESIITRTWTATDDCGNTSSCVQTITIEDNDAPVITCPADISISCSDSTDPSNTGEATATDNCSNVTITSNDVRTPGSCTNEGTIARTWTATDECGNVSICVQTITITDSDGPVISCPADITISCDASTDPANTGEATATDACSGVVPDGSIGYSDVVVGGSCPDESTITRTWTATDDCGNVSTCDQIITIVDNTAPSITCPADITVSCDAGTDEAVTGSPVVSDNCSASVAVSYSDNTIDGSDCTGHIERTWTATDDCGNSTSCTQQIYIEDVTPPVITLPTPASPVPCGGDRSPASTGTPTATDNCTASGVIVFTYSDVNTSTDETCGDDTVEGTLLRTWVATDACGNQSTAVQTIPLRGDVFHPTLTCPADLTIECSDDSSPTGTGTATATDNCSLPENISIVYDDDISNLTECGGTGYILRTWYALDECGNSDSCTQTITIVDTTPPVITCPAAASISCGDDRGPDNTGYATATDNCDEAGDITITYSDNISGTEACTGATGTITRTWTAADLCGNSTTCDQIISVDGDILPPEIECPPDVTISCTDDRTPGALGYPKAKDNCTTDPDDLTIAHVDDESNLSGCTGYITRAWTITDLCGNSNVCNQIITIEDNNNGRIAATLGEEEAKDLGSSILTNGREFQYFIDDKNAIRVDIINIANPFNTGSVLYHKDMELWQSGATYSFRADMSYRRYFTDKRVRPFVGAGLILYKNIKPGAYSNDYMNGQIVTYPPNGDGYDYWIGYVSGGALVKISKFLYYELSLRMNKDFTNNYLDGDILRLRPSLSSRFLFMINKDDD